MSSFEFISILMSILIGLGVTNLLAGAGRAFYRRQKNQLQGNRVGCRGRRSACPTIHFRPRASR